jgi:hypothetical protein
MTVKSVLILVKVYFFRQLKDRHFLNINFSHGRNCNETFFLVERNIPQLANRRFVIMKPNEMGHLVCYRRITKLHSVSIGGTKLLDEVTDRD